MTRWIYQKFKSVPLMTVGIRAAEQNETYAGGTAARILRNMKTVRRRRVSFN